MHSNIADVCNESIAQILLDEEVPALDVATAIVFGDRVSRSAHWKRDKPAGKIREDRRGNTVLESKRCATNGISRDCVGCRSHIRRREIDRELVTEEAHAARIFGNACARAYNSAIVDAVSDSETRRQYAPARVNAGAFGLAIDAARYNVGALRQRRI